jgi:chromosome segregation ATPase
VQRTQAALVELESRLEARARADAATRKRVAELEKERAEATALAGRLVSAQEALSRARAELEDLRSENEFLNGEVARYHQRNKDLMAQMKRS